MICAKVRSQASLRRSRDFIKIGPLATFQNPRTISYGVPLDKRRQTAVSGLCLETAPVDQLYCHRHLHRRPLGADQALGCARSSKISVSAHSGCDPLRYLKELTIRKIIHQRSNLDRHLFTLADHRHAKRPPCPIPIRPSRSYESLTPATRAGYNSNSNQR